MYLKTIDPDTNHNPESYDDNVAQLNFTQKELDILIKLNNSDSLLSKIKEENVILKTNNKLLNDQVVFYKKENEVLKDQTEKHNLLREIILLKDKISRLEKRHV